MKYCITLLLSQLLIVSAQYGNRYHSSEQKIKQLDTWNKESIYEPSKTTDSDYKNTDGNLKIKEKWEERYENTKYEDSNNKENNYDELKYEAPKVKSIYEGDKYEAPKPKSIYDGPKYETPKPKSIYEGPKYEAPKPKSIYEGPKYEAPKPKSIYEGPKYEAPQFKQSKFEAPKLKLDTFFEEPKYEAPKLKEFYEREIPQLKKTISNYESRKPYGGKQYENPKLEEFVNEKPKRKSFSEEPKEEVNKLPGVIKLQYQEPWIIEQKQGEEEINYVDYYKQPLILGRFGLGFDKRTATSNGLMRPLTLDQLKVVGKNYWGRCREIYIDGAYHVTNCNQREV